MKDGDLFAFAGLWERWEGPGEAIESCSIIVTEANELLQPIHDRMPVILAPSSYDVWLDPLNHNTSFLEPLLGPYAADQMETYPVSKKVNGPANDDPDCLVRL